MPLPLSIVVYRRHFCLNSCAAGLLRHCDSISNCCTKRWAVQAIAGIFPPLMTWPWLGARTCRPCVLEREAVFALLGIASRSDGRNPFSIHEIAMANRASIYTTQRDEVERIRL